jgi:murein DD-endopeptidase MepM/ murein hydrolase activator NlpD
LNAIFDGVIANREESHSGVGGRQLVLTNEDGINILYAHLNNNLGAQPGERVNAGDPIATSGVFGLSPAPHLHIEALGGYDLADIWAGASLGTPATENIPLGAKGGTVMQETLLIAGEAGPEEIIPYSKIDENTRVTIQAQQESTEELIETITPSLIEFVGLLRQINSNIKEGKTSSIEAIFDNVRALR